MIAESSIKPVSVQRAPSFYMWSVSGLGALLILYSLTQLPHANLDRRFFFIALLTIGLGSRISVQIPRFSSHITVSDAFIFIILLLYDGEAAMTVAAVEAFLSTMRFSRKRITLCFNTGVVTVSTFLTVGTLRASLGPIPSLLRGGYSSKYVMALAVMALVQYAANSGMVAFAAALKMSAPFWQTWKRYYLWTSLTYFTGASAAGIIANLFGEIGLLALVIMTPIIAIVFFTYRIYLKNLEATAAQAEQAERHVEELNHYIVEQERLREQFSQLEKLSALGELASGVAHDFNNTLAGILGRAQLMMRTEDPEKIRRGLQIIIRAAEDGSKTVRRIQDFARQRRDKGFVPVSVDQILFDVSEITRPRWKDSAEATNVHISLDLELHSGALVMGDESELREVLVNMVFNAVDAMPKGGKLTLSAEDEGESVVISVTDNGVGMTPDVRSRIFDPFFTTKGKAGLGLGLAVSYGIIRRHEGLVEVESQLGAGTTFKIKLPVAKGCERAAPEAVEIYDHLKNMPALHSTVEKRPKVLVVDDEEHVRALLRDILESEGCKVSLAENGSGALAQFDENRFDAVFTDIGMPGMSGWELAHAIRERDQKIPIAVITGWGEAVGSGKQKSAEVNWVVTKPFALSSITEIAQEIRRRRDSQRRRAGLRIVAA